MSATVDTGDRSMHPYLVPRPPTHPTTPEAAGKSGTAAVSRPSDPWCFGQITRVTEVAELQVDP